MPSDLRRIISEFFFFFIQHFIIEWKVPESFSGLILTIPLYRAFVLGLVLLALFIKAQPAFERDFSPNDPRIQHPYIPEQ